MKNISDPLNFSILFLVPLNFSRRISDPLKNDQPHIHELPVIYIPDEKGILSL